MYILASIFMIAAAEIIGMFSFRWWQLRAGKVSCDEEAHHHVMFNVRGTTAKYATIIALHAERVHQIHIAPRVHVATQAVVHYLAEQFGAIHKKLMRIKRSLEGRNEIMAHGEASPFFKTIAEYKLNGSVKKEDIDK
ncbi:MAG: hypothetical protein HZC03_01925 [Candidatus Lloydbacteria bacterium]|nr:hypothetical protein [Candidatus Lloydbacteria bacterium]